MKPDVFFDDFTGGEPVERYDFPQQTWLDTYIGKYKWYRKLRKGIWYKHQYTKDAEELSFPQGETWWARYGEVNRYSIVIETIYYPKKFIKNDPVYNCELYKNDGCSHVDGFLCDFPNCSMLQKYRKENKINNFPDALKYCVEHKNGTLEELREYIEEDMIQRLATTGMINI